MAGLTPMILPHAGWGRGGKESPGATPEASAAAARTPAAGTPATAADVRTLRVPAEKIDHLLDVAGETMQYRTRLAHSLGGEAGQSPGTSPRRSGQVSACSTT